MGQAVGLKFDISFDILNLLAQTRLLRFLLNYINIRVDLYLEYVLVLFQLILLAWQKSIVVFHDQTKLGTVNEGSLLLFYFCKCGAHDSNYHVENDEKRKDSCTEEDKPESDDLVTISVLDETF